MKTTVTEPLRKNKDSKNNNILITNKGEKMICSNLLACAPAKGNTRIDYLVRLERNIKAALINGDSITVNGLTYNYCDLFTWVTESLPYDNDQFTKQFVSDCLNVDYFSIAEHAVSFLRGKFIKAAAGIAKEIAPDALAEIERYYADEEPRHELPRHELPRYELPRHELPKYKNCC